MSISKDGIFCTTLLSHVWMSLCIRFEVPHGTPIKGEGLSISALVRGEGGVEEAVLGVSSLLGLELQLTLARTCYYAIQERTWGGGEGATSCC